LLSELGSSEANFEEIKSLLKYSSLFKVTGTILQSSGTNFHKVFEEVKDYFGTDDNLK
jgi:hypothetical protein